jgi:acetyl esterase/lipase
MDFTNPKALARMLLPKMPMLLKTAAFHTLSLSETSKKWDLKTEITVKLIRSILLGTPEPVSKSQKVSIRDPGVPSHVRISKVTIPPPEEDDIRQALFKSIDELKKASESYTKPEMVPVEAEWTGYRTDSVKGVPDSAQLETEKYEALMKDVKNDITVLYVHGGAYYLMDPASHRPLTAKLAELTGGRVFSVRYRLAPQNPFPSALLDAFLSYLYLLYPPTGALHKPVAASKIVIGGDSAGGNLSLVLLQLILQLHRTSPAGEIPTVMFNGQKVQVPLPAGISLASPWTDVTRCMPSLHTNAKYDYLPPPGASEAHDFPPCDNWPANPPRVDLYCDGSALCHPLVSPMAAMDWKNSPPVLINLGEEMLADECKVLARRMSQQGVTVVWDEYEAMPHVFPMMLQGSATSEMCYAQWADFIKLATEKPNEVKTKAHFVTALKLVRKEISIAELIEMPDDEVLKRMNMARDEKIKAFEARQAVPPPSKL